MRIVTLLIGLALSSCAYRGLDPGPPTPWTTGNAVSTLVDGAQFYPPMLAAIRSAKKSITFETFAYVDAPITTTFTNALAERAKVGVNVHVILDALGSAKLSSAHLRTLHNAGAEAHLYHPFSLLHPARTNNRTHRKILIVDGKRAFTGGAGFANSWVNDWRDTQYEIHGPAVSQLQQSFAENWQELTGKTLVGPDYFPPQQAVGSLKAKFISDTPDNRINPLAAEFLNAIEEAQHTLILAQSYFVPTARFRRALLAAARRGVHIEILVPGKIIDSAPTRYASQHHWDQYLQAGIRLYEYQPSMMHGKLLIADRRLVIIGSGNFDDRSFFINDEVNLHIDNPAFAATQLRMFRQDLSKASEVTLADLSHRRAPLWKRLPSVWLSPQL